MKIIHTFSSFHSKMIHSTFSIFRKISFHNRSDFLWLNGLGHEQVCFFCSLHHEVKLFFQMCWWKSVVQIRSTKCKFVVFIWQNTNSFVFHIKEVENDSSRWSWLCKTHFFWRSCFSCSSQLCNGLRHYSSYVEWSWWRFVRCCFVVLVPNSLIAIFLLFLKFSCSKNNFCFLVIHYTFVCVFYSFFFLEVLSMNKN